MTVGIRFVTLAVLGILSLCVEARGTPKRVITLGTVEEVILLPWKIRLPARIDTGAAKSVIDARDLKVKGDMAEFRLPESQGAVLFRLPIVEWRHLRTGEGLKRRPIVEIEICLGPKRLRTKVALDDRKGLKYPFLVGRNTLKGNFIVDVKRKKITVPACSS